MKYDENVVQFLNISQNFVLNGGAKAELEASFGKQAEGVGIQVTLKPLVFYLIGSIGIKETPYNPEIPLFKVNYIHNITNEISIYDSFK